MIPLGGFGWGQLGVTQVDAPALPLASVGGVWALSFLVMVVAGLLLLAWERWGSGRRAGALVLAAGALVLAVVPASIPIPAPDGRTLDVATIQVDVASVQDLVGADEDVAVARLNIDRHLELADDPPDLVVWGEGALDPGVTSDALQMTAVSQAIATVGAPDDRRRRDRRSRRHRAHRDARVRRDGEDRRPVREGEAGAVRRVRAVPQAARLDLGDRSGAGRSDARAARCR